MKKINAKHRADVILGLIRDGQECSVGDLAVRFGVSEMTVRRDLDALAGEGRIIRTHGGAAAASGVVFEFRFLERAREHRDAKRRVAARAASLVQDGMTVMLDSGTTTLALAEALRSKRDLTVVTTSLPIASVLQYSDVIDVVLLGGHLRCDAPDLSGSLTLQGLQGLHADIAFVGVDAIDLKGTTYSHSIEVAHLIATMAAAADVVYVVADNSKVGQAALAKSGTLSQWEGLIINPGLDSAKAQALKQCGVKIIWAGPILKQQ
jgi:DeoR/GlpR family transcriptional regulator of sugar metabolism